MKRNTLFSLLLNIAIIAFVVGGIIGHYTGFGPVSPPSFSYYHYYTQQSNILNAVICLIFIVFLILEATGKIKQIHKYVYIMKHVGAVAVTVTFLVVVLILTPGSAATGEPVSRLYTGTGMFFHVFAPVLTIVTFLLFERNKDIKYPQTLFALIPLVIYIIYYTSICCTHMNSDGTIDRYYDVYTFFRFGPTFVPLFCLGIVAINMFSSWALWFGNKKIDIKWLYLPLKVKH